MNGTERDGDSPNAVRPRRHAGSAHQRISWLAANRILNGQDGGPGTEDLRTLIAIASSSTSPTSSGSAGGAHVEAESAGREAVLTAFREGAGATAEPANANVAQTAVRGRNASSFSLTLRFATAVLLVCGVGVAAASAGVLPEGMQRIAHNYFGIGGVSAPSTHVPSSSAVTSGAQSNIGSGSGTAPTRSVTPNVAPTSSSAMVTLCEHVSQAGGNKWQVGLSAADQATLITAADGEHKVKGYCAQLLAGAGKNAAPSSSATATPDTPSPTPSVDATETHGNAHVSHSPAAHSTDTAH